MSKRKKVNPNRRPVTAAEVKRERDKAQQIMYTLILYSLLDAGFTVEEIKRFERKFRYAAEAFEHGQITNELMLKVLETEYTQKIRELDEIGSVEFFLNADVVEDEA